MALYIAIRIVGLIIGVILFVGAEFFASSEKCVSFVQLCGWQVASVPWLYGSYKLVTGDFVAVDETDGLVLALCGIVYLIVSGLAIYELLTWDKNRSKQYKSGKEKLRL